MSYASPYAPTPCLTAGELDQRVRIESKSVTRDASLGSEVDTWAPIATTPDVWAKLTDVREANRGGDESAVQDQRIVQGRTAVLIRFRTDVTIGMRIVWPTRGRTLKIVSKAETRRGTGLELSCEEFSV